MAGMRIFGRDPGGRNDPAGRPWREALQGEIEYLRKTGGRTLLGTPGHTVKDLLGDGA